LSGQLGEADANAAQGDTEAHCYVEASVAYADGQGAVGVPICDKPLPLDLDDEVEEARGVLISYEDSRGRISTMKNMAWIVVLFLIATSASAADSLSDRMKPIHVIGFADESCGTWAESANNPAKREAFQFWVRGFATGYNYGNRDGQVPGDSFPNLATAALYIDKYCRDHPLSGLSGAAISLMDELRGLPSGVKSGQ